MQRKSTSLLEACLGTAVGFGVSLILQIVILPRIGCHVSLAVDILVVCIFTIASVIRSYWMRRFFNWLHVKGILT
ncbi:DUF7220 family protein [Methylocaldum sp.]|uniref:DUF7220 family protein n=1 Tax=Methylocaldum sp. TaxID=1969727 RepID=UPI003BEEB1A7